jgi:hypothetical protein
MEPPEKWLCTQEAALLLPNSGDHESRFFEFASKRNSTAVP